MTTPNFAYYETEAQRLATRIRDLKGLTPEFTEVRDTAQRQLEHHFRLIEETEATLTDLRQQAAAAAMQLGAEPPADLPALADLSAEEQAEVEAILNDDTPFEGIAAANDAPETFDTVGQVAERITAALADMAINQPDTPDESDAPELTTEQCERVEADMAQALKAYA